MTEQYARPAAAAGASAHCRGRDYAGPRRGPLRAGERGTMFEGEPMCCGGLIV
jgi:hypothetical protein